MEITNLPARKNRQILNRNRRSYRFGISFIAAAAFLIRDAQMEGNKIRILEELVYPVAVWTASGMSRKATSYEADGKWKHISKPFGICSARYPH
jgi:myosin-crossreactive antigen